MFVRKDHEMVMGNKEKFIIIPPRHYCIIENPVERNEVSRSESESTNEPNAKRVRRSTMVSIILDL